MSSIQEFMFQDELASLFTQRPGPGMHQQQQQQDSWFADLMQMDHGQLCWEQDIPLSAEDFIKREPVVETAAGDGGARTPSAGGVGTPNATSSISSSSSEAGGGGGAAAGEGESAGRCKKEEGGGEDGKGEDDDEGDKGKKG